MRVVVRTQVEPDVHHFLLVGCWNPLPLERPHHGDGLLQHALPHPAVPADGTQLSRHGFCDATVLRTPTRKATRNATVLHSPKRNATRNATVLHTPTRQRTTCRMFRIRC